MRVRRQWICCDNQQLLAQTVEHHEVALTAIISCGKFFEEIVSTSLNSTHACKFDGMHGCKNLENPYKR